MIAESRYGKRVVIQSLPKTTNDLTRARPAPREPEPYSETRPPLTGDGMEEPHSKIGRRRPLSLSKALKTREPF